MRTKAFRLWTETALPPAPSPLTPCVFAFPVIVAFLVLATAVAGQGNRGSIAGRIITPDGPPAADVQVFVARSGQLQSPVARTRSAWDGLYQITGLPPGEFVVGAYTDPAVVTLYPGVPERDPAQLVTVFDGVPAEGIDIWLLPAPRRFSVAGRVTDAQGRGFRNVDIEYGGPDATQAGLWSVRHPDGYFTIESVPSGTLVLLARAESPEGLLMGIASTEVTLGAVEDVRLTLGKPGTIEGRITPERGQLPAGVRPRVALVQTLLRSSAIYPDETASAGSDGAFRIENLLGHLRIEVRDLPAGWSVTRILRDGRTLPDPRLTLSSGEMIGGLEIKIDVR